MGTWSQDAAVSRAAHRPLRCCRGPHHHNRPSSRPGWANACRRPTLPPSALTLRTGAASASNREKRKAVSKSDATR
eukprot:1872393-Prymnesium_polylepis.1